MPHDHTSLLATVRDWLGLGDAYKRGLSSPRIAAAPTIAPVLVEPKPLVWPVIKLPLEAAEHNAPSMDEGNRLHDIHKIIHVAAEGLKRGSALIGEEKTKLLAGLHRVGDALHRFM